MRAIFGPHTEQVLALLTDLWRLSPAEINKVTRAWKEASDLDRAEALAQLNRAASRDERHQILAAASVARREAMDVASMHNRTDWAFWAAAWDAAAAIAADDNSGSEYDVLTAPLMTVLPSLSRGRGGVRIPAQRSRRQRGARLMPTAASARRRSPEQPGAHGAHGAHGTHGAHGAGMSGRA
jgi:hypothetical protein